MHQHGGRLRGLAGSAALALAALAFALAAGEIAVRLAFVSVDAAKARHAAALATGRTAPDQAALEGLPEARTLFELGKPNQRAVHKGLPFRTNSTGIRGPEYTRFPAPGVFRIVVGGDSFTMGSGVREEEAYPARLEALLNRDGSGRYEVLNLGLSGLNLTYVARRIGKIGLDYHPDLIVYGFTTNDIEGPSAVAKVTEETVRIFRERYARFAASRSRLLREVWPRLVALRDLVLPPEGSLKRELEYNYFRNPDAWKDFTAGLDHLARIGEETGVCVHVLIHTNLGQLNWLHPFLGIYDRVEQAARERGLTVTQSFPAFRGMRPVDLQVNVFADSHPNALGHQILAEALYEGLRALPERCLVARPRPILGRGTAGG